MIVQHHNEGRLSYLLRVAVAHITQHAPRAETVYDGQGQTGKTLANELDSLRALLPELHPPCTPESHAKRAPGHPFPEPSGGHLITRLRPMIISSAIFKAAKLPFTVDLDSKAAATLLAAIPEPLMQAAVAGKIGDPNLTLAINDCGLWLAYHWQTVLPGLYGGKHGMTGHTGAQVITGKLEAYYVNEPALRQLMNDVYMPCPKCSGPLNLERGGPAANHAPQVQCFSCDIMATGHTHEEAYENLQRRFPRSQEYRLLEDGETTSVELGDEFQHTPGVWVRTKRTGKVVQGSYVGHYRRPVPAPNPWPLPWYNDHKQTGCFGNIMAANGEPVAQIQSLSPRFEKDAGKRNQWRNDVAQQVCDIVNDAATIVAGIPATLPPP